MVPGFASNLWCGSARDRLRILVPFAMRFAVFCSHIVLLEGRPPSVERWSQSAISLLAFEQGGHQGHQGLCRMMRSVVDFGAAGLPPAGPITGPSPTTAERLHGSGFGFASHEVPRRDRDGGGRRGRRLFFILLRPLASASPDPPRVRMSIQRCRRLRRPTTLVYRPNPSAGHLRNRKGGNT